ncbi:MAG: purine/pyrimidine-nucleoside phosphorylase [Synergistaceae bacterium]|jgi:hypothetical protein|nr:purine/pyrimidine-nucleoside phosphorylase [Synergistaceae bacterium]
MDVFKSVDMAVKGNIYEDGKVTGRTFRTPEGERKTAGIMLPGSYSFSTSTNEKMEITNGTVEVKLTPNEEWTGYGEGEFFLVPAGVSFEIRCDSLAEYVCSYS